jgi:hypothetical protein
VVEGLATMLSRANDVGHIKVVVSHIISGGVNHQQYTYDTMIMIDPTGLEIMNVKAPSTLL